MGLNPNETLSPKALRKTVWAGANAPSFSQGSHALKELAELNISDQRTRRATVRIGNERVAQRDAEVARFQALPLPERRTAPAGVAPQLAVVEMDGGRMQVRDRKSPKEAPEVVEEHGRKGRFWRETKVGVLLTMSSSTSAEDPCPTIPEIFVDPQRLPKICQEIKGVAAADKNEAKAAAAESPPETDQAKSSKRPGQPEPLVRTVVATRQNVTAFGWMLMTAAWHRGFLAAKRKAFLGDGLEQNWTVWQRHFSDFVPILDLMHALSYVYAAAMAERSFAQGWPVYCQWAQWVWSGRVDLVIAALTERQMELGLPTQADGDASPRQVVAESLRYLQNQRSRMKYDAYRRQGLPLTTAHGESVIKQINRRVKGTEKFWSQGGEALLQLSADYLSETDPMEKFWKEREQSATGQRAYSTAA